MVVVVLEFEICTQAVDFASLCIADDVIPVGKRPLHEDEALCGPLA